MSGRLAVLDFHNPSVKLMLPSINTILNANLQTQFLSLGGFRLPMSHEDFCFRVWVESCRFGTREGRVGSYSDPTDLEYQN